MWQCVGGFMTFNNIRCFFVYLIKCIINVLLRLFWILPERDNVILFTSFWGKQFSCNPKYICEYIYGIYGDKYIYVWAFKNKTFSDTPSWIKKVTIGSITYYYYRLFAKVIITNCGEYPQIPVRKSQIMINTWHGGGCYKKCGLLQPGANKKGFFYQKLVLMSFKQTDIVLSTCKLASEKLFRESFKYNGIILEIGYPRNDILVNLYADIYIKIREEVLANIKLSNKHKVCLFAPTYRDHVKTGNFGIDFLRLKSILAQKFGGTWDILYRGHHFSTNCGFNNEYIDVSDYPDMQKLLLTADVFITDYSSAIWDYQLLKKPAFLFASDLQEYLDGRGFYYPIYKWGVPIASDMDKLECNIREYNSYNAIKQYEDTHLSMGDCETGHANEKLLAKIIELL